MMGATLNQAGPILPTPAQHLFYTMPKPSPKWEMERSLALYFEQGDLTFLKSFHSTAYGYILALEKGEHIAHAIPLDSDT